MEILKIEKISKTYEIGKNQIKALNNISFKVNKGEFISIIGASGSGKTTLLHMIAGVDKPTFGNVFLEGININKLSEEKLAILKRRKLGLIYQEYNLIQTLNVEENIILPILLDNKKVNQNKLNNILEILNLENRRNFFPSQLSGGEQQ